MCYYFSHSHFASNSRLSRLLFFFFLNDPAPPDTSPLPQHDALPTPPAPPAEPVTPDPVPVPAAVTDSVAANNTASATSTVRAGSNADLAIIKSDSPDPVGVGQLITYLLTVVNNGTEIATGVTTSDTLPGTVTFISSSPSQGSCAGTTTVTCGLGTLAVNGTATVSIVVQAN